MLCVLIIVAVGLGSLAPHAAGFRIGRSVSGCYRHGKDESIPAEMALRPGWKLKLLRQRTPEAHPLFGWQDISSNFLAAAPDYAAEIENAVVGEEIYGPIFRAGLFLFASGLVSVAIAAFIINNSESWEGLEDEFQQGKEAQFIDTNISDDGRYEVASLTALTSSPNSSYSTSESSGNINSGNISPSSRSDKNENRNAGISTFEKTSVDEEGTELQNLDI